MPPMPKLFGELSAGYGLMIRCAACSRGASHTRAELLKRFGEEGRVADVIGRFRCSNCASKRPGRPAPGVRVEVIKLRISVGGTEGDRARAKLGPVDKLMWDIERLKPPPID